MKKCGLFSFFISLVVIFFIFTNQLQAAPYYEGKKLHIIVGTAPGGGYDRLARLLSKYLPKYIPGKPTIIIENMPGAASRIACNYVYNLPKPDGLTIVSMERGMPIAHIAKAQGIKFDIMKFSWIGSAASESSIFVIRSDLPYKTVDDLRKAKGPIYSGELTTGGLTTMFNVLLKEFAGINLEPVTYTSVPEVTLALERKEIDGQSGTYSSLKPLIARGLVRPLIRGRSSEPGIENLPVNEDLTTDTKGKNLMAMLSAVDRVGRPYVASPGAPAEAMNALRSAFAKASKDPQLKEDAKKIMSNVEYLPPDECIKVLNLLLKQPDDLKREFKKYGF